MAERTATNSVMIFVFHTPDELKYTACADPEGGGGKTGPGPPLKITKILGVLAIQVRIPWKIAAARPAFNVGPSSAPQRNAI